MKIRALLILLLLPVACHPQTPAPADLRDKLWQDAKAVLDERRAVLGDATRTQLRELIAAGAAKLEGAPPERVRDAEQALKMFVEAMVTDARGDAGEKGVIEVLEKHYKAVRDKVCPVIPFC